MFQVTWKVIVCVSLTAVGGSANDGNFYGQQGGGGGGNTFVGGGNNFGNTGNYGGSGGGFGNTGTGVIGGGGGGGFPGSSEEVGGGGGGGDGGPAMPVIPGVAGQDYPILEAVPNTGFSCNGQIPGYYADTAPEAGCQVFHICEIKERMHSFLCPIGTIFNQQYFVCDWWYNFDCSTAEQFYNLNSLIGQVDGSNNGGGSGGNIGGTGGGSIGGTGGGGGVNYGQGTGNFGGTGSFIGDVRNTGATGGGGGGVQQPSRGYNQPGK